MDQDVTSALQQAAITIKADPTNPHIGTLVDATDIPEHNPAMLSFFSLDGIPTSSESKQLQDVYTWAKDRTVNGTNEEIVQVLKDIRFRIGGRPALSEIHTYMKLSRQADMLGATAKAMER